MIKVYTIVGIIIAVFIFSVWYERGTDRWESITVTDKVYHAGTGDAPGYYLIFTDDTTLKNEDSLWWWKWASSDLYGELEVNKLYNMHVYGWRIPFLSQYPNIIEFEAIPRED